MVNDGIIAYAVVDVGSYGPEDASTIYVVFSPDQIKSATDNVGTFDGGNGDIRYRRDEQSINQAKAIDYLYELSLSERPYIETGLSRTDEDYEEGEAVIKELSSTITTADGYKLQVSKRSRQELVNILLISKEDNITRSVVSRIQDAVRGSVLLEEHRDRIKVDDKREAKNPSNPNTEKVQRFYGAVSVSSVLYCVKTTAAVFCAGNNNRIRGYEITEIELLAPNSTPAPSKGQTVAPTSNSISLAKLVENVELSHDGGKLLSDAMAEARRKSAEMQVKGAEESEICAMDVWYLRV